MSSSPPTFYLITLPHYSVDVLTLTPTQIYTPTGSGVWYGRVSTHEVEAIVAQTLEEGLILAPLLRGGINITRKPGCARTLNDW